MSKNALTNNLIILILGCFTCQASCSYNEVKFSMSRSYYIDTEGFAKLKAKANVYYKYSSTFFEIVLRDPKYDTYRKNRSQNNQNDLNYSQNTSYDMQFSNYEIIFPLDFDEKVFNFSLTYDNKTYSNKNINDKSSKNENNGIYGFVDDNFTMVSHNERTNDSYVNRLTMNVFILNNNLLIKVSNLPVFFDYYINNTEASSTSSDNILNNEQQENNTKKSKRKRKRRFLSYQEKEDPRGRFFEVTIGFTIFKKLEIKPDKAESKIAFYPFNYKTCDFCRSSKNLSRLHNFAFNFDLEGHQNDQLFKYGKPQRKCIINEEVDLLGNPLKFNITENAANKYTFYGFLLKLRLVKFPAFSIINDDNFVLPVIDVNSTNSSYKNITKYDENYFISKNFSQLTKITVMPKSHRMLILLDDDNQYWQIELENTLTNYFPNSVHLIGHLHFDQNKDTAFSEPYENGKNKTHQNAFNIFDANEDINFEINVNLNENESIIENISKIIRMYKPDVIVNFIDETKDSTEINRIFNMEKIYKSAFPENSTINFDDILYIKSHGNLAFNHSIIDKIHQFDFAKSSVQSDCGIQLKKEKNVIKGKRNKFSFLHTDKCFNCSFEFNNRTFYSWDMSVFHSKALFKTLLEKNKRKGAITNELLNKISLSSIEDDFYEYKKTNKNEQSIHITDIIGPSFLSNNGENSSQNKDIKINLINDCNKCSNFAKICAMQYKEEYLTNTTESID